MILADIAWLTDLPVLNGLLDVVPLDTIARVVGRSASQRLRMVHTMLETSCTLVACELMVKCIIYLLKPETCYGL